jgi:hypothetical protein
MDDAQDIRDNIIGKDPTRYKQLKNGAIYDLQAGRICANPGGGSEAITIENAEMFQDYRSAARAAAITEAQDASGGVHGWGRTVKHMQAIILADENKSNMIAVRAAEFVGRATDYMPDRRHSAAADPAPGGATLQLSGGMVARIMDKLAERQDQQPEVPESLEHHELERDV